MTPWTVAYLTPLFMGTFRQEYWNGFPFPLGDLPDPGIEPMWIRSQVDSLPLSHQASSVVGDALSWASQRTWVSSYSQTCQGSAISFSRWLWKPTKIPLHRKTINYKQEAQERVTSWLLVETGPSSCLFQTDDGPHKVPDTQQMTVEGINQ